ncbi:MAG TPA: hypothetical protein PKL92_05115 [Aquaticitalea sp.]|nr:hypothetical protein [Aquaticitalea sp.]HNU59816.1 hypothetical protein [Aquaticitalea sp.]
MNEQKQFVATDEAKGQAKQLRIFAALLWIGALVAQIVAIRLILKAVNMEESILNVWTIGLVVLDLALVLIGSMLWKKAGRLDPPSEKNKFLFMLQSQLGVIAAIVAFLPLILFVLTNKNIDGKQKAIFGSIAGVAMLIAGIGSYDFNPPSIEKYTEQINAQTDVIKELNNGVDMVYWTPSGNKLHIYNDCQHVRSSVVSEGTVEQAWQARKIDNNEVCKTCIAKAENAKKAKLNELVE